MKLVVSSDWHLDWTTHGVPRFEELRDALVGPLLSAIVKTEADAFIFLGDLTDPDSGSVIFIAVATAILFARELREHGVSSIWIAGNHDVIEDGSGATTLTPLRACEDEYIRVYEEPADFILRESVRFIALPYTSTATNYDPKKFLETSMRAKKGRDPVVILSHLSVPGVIPGEEVTQMPRGRDVVFPIEAASGADLILQGHYHRQQRVALGISTPMYIPGSLARLTFSEEDHHPGFLVVEI